MTINSSIFNFFNIFKSKNPYSKQNNEINVTEHNKFYSINMDDIINERFNTMLYEQTKQSISYGEIDNYYKGVMDCYEDYLNYFTTKNYAYDDMLFFQERINEVWYYLHFKKPHSNYWLELEYINDDVYIINGSRRFVAYKLFIMKHYDGNFGQYGFKFIKRYKRKQYLLRYFIRKLKYISH